MVGIVQISQEIGSVPTRLASQRGKICGASTQVVDVDVPEVDEFGSSAYSGAGTR